MAIPRILKYFYNETPVALRVCQLQWYNFGASTHGMTAQEANMHAGYAEMVADNSGTSYAPFITAMRGVNPNIVIFDYNMLGEVLLVAPLTDANHPIQAYLSGQEIPIASVTFGGGQATITLASPVQGAWAIGNNPYVWITNSGNAANNGGWAVASITSTTIFKIAGGGPAGPGGTVKFIESASSSNYMIDPTNVAFRTYMATVTTAHINLGYDGTLLDVCGITNLFAGSTPGVFTDPITGAMTNADRWMQRMADYLAVLNSTNGPNGNGLDSSGNKYPLLTNGIGHGDDFFGATQSGKAYPTHAITAGSASGSQITLTAAGHGLGMGDWAIVIGNATTACNGHWQVLSASGNNVTLETGIAAIGAPTGSGTIQRSAATRVDHRVLDSAMSEEWLRGEGSSITNWPGLPSGGTDNWTQSANAAIQHQREGHRPLCVTKIWTNHSHVAAAAALSTALTNGTTYSSLTLATGLSQLPGTLPKGAMVELLNNTGNHTQILRLTSQALVTDTVINVEDGTVAAGQGNFQANAAYAVGSGTASNQSGSWLQYLNQDGMMDQYENHTGTDHVLDQWHKIHLATHMLTNNGLAFSHFRHDFDSASPLGGTGREGEYVGHWLWARIKSVFGAPSESWKGLPDPDGNNNGITAAAFGGVYRRFFFGNVGGTHSTDSQACIVLVNPDTAASHTYALPAGTYNDVDNSSATGSGSFSGTITLAKQGTTTFQSTPSVLILAK